MDARDQQRMLEEARAELAAAKRRVVHLQQVVDGLTGLLNPTTTTGSIPMTQVSSLPGISVGQSSDDGDFIKPRDAILAVFKRRVGLPMVPREIYNEIRHWGLVNPNFSSGQAAYDQALRRLADEPDSGVVREASGAYVYRPRTTNARTMTAAQREAYLARREAEKGSVANSITFDAAGRIVRPESPTGRDGD